MKSGSYKWVAFIVLAALAGGANQAKAAQLKVACTTTDLEAVVKFVGGGLVESFAVAKGTQDPHQIEAKPSFMVKFRSADLVVSHGLELEAAWLQPLIKGSRNSKLASADGLLELGPSLNPLEKASGSVSRAEGDVHPEGNPHFQLDPIRMGEAAVLIAMRLAKLDERNQERYLARAKEFKQKMADQLKVWQARINKSGIKEFVSYHRSFVYFADRFGLKNTLELEPKPGIPPTASHLVDVIAKMKANNINLVLIENYFDDSVRSKLQSAIPGLSVVKVSVSVEGDKGINTNFDLLERLVQVFESKNKQLKSETGK